MTKKHLDINQLAKSIANQVISQDEEKENTQPEKNPAAVALGRLGGLKGGKARANSLTPERRAEIAKNAAQKRWG